MKLPFIKAKQWPISLKLSGESRYGFSDNDELIEEALDQLIHALGAKDGAALMEAIETLIHLIESRHDDAPDALEDALGV